MTESPPPARRLRAGKPLATVLACLLTVTAWPLGADPLRDATLLLEASGTPENFRRLAARQTDAIIRHYQVIVGTSADTTLPTAIREEITACYARVYHWENFADGVARILASKLSPQQMRLLTDFYLSRGLPPYEIDTFKATIAMAGEIERASADFILANSGSCVEQDARIILGYLRARSATGDVTDQQAPPPVRDGLPVSSQ